MSLTGRHSLRDLIARGWRRLRGTNNNIVNMLHADGRTIMGKMNEQTQQVDILANGPVDQYRQLQARINEDIGAVNGGSGSISNSMWSGAIGYRNTSRATDSIAIGYQNSSIEEGTGYTEAEWARMLTPSMTSIPQVEPPPAPPSHENGRAVRSIEI